MNENLPKNSMNTVSSQMNAQNPPEAQTPMVQPIPTNGNPQIIVRPAPPEGFLKMESGKALWSPKVAFEKKEPLVGYVIEPVQLGMDDGVPFLAFLFQLTSPSHVIDKTGRVFQANVKEEVLVRYNYEFEPWERYALNPDYVYQIWALPVDIRDFENGTKAFTYDWYTFNTPVSRMQIHPKSAAKFRRPQQ